MVKNPSQACCVMVGVQTSENWRLKKESFTILQTVFGAWLSHAKQLVTVEIMRENGQKPFPGLMCPGGISDLTELAIKNGKLHHFTNSLRCVV